MSDLTKPWPRTDLENERYSTCYMCAAGGNADTTIIGKLYPESSLIEEGGNRYCPFHYNMRFTKKRLDEAVIDIQEDNA
jgi:hypothetical protein